MVTEYLTQHKHSSAWTSWSIPDNSKLDTVVVCHSPDYGTYVDTMPSDAARENVQWLMTYRTEDYITTIVE